jgi:hypothetical protein
MASSHEETQDAPMMDGAKEEWAAKRAEDAEKGPGEHLGGSGGLSEHIGEDGSDGAPIYDSRSTEQTTNHADTDGLEATDPIEAARLDQSEPGSQDADDHEPARPGPGDEHTGDDGSLDGPDAETHSVETHTVENETDPDIDPEPRRA